ncbi:MAG: sigma-54-dependent Fis family transcriptional regulator [Rhodospirillaceae bacterium]|jgi:two-component system, response regulator FlrC|nr:sigma-54-dependent Fis family transcriptional regulator [Rhodospirillaceae bacterium]MBT5244386.1 sigma-54-dependent Fis family transcriptional regulator [Rhodospirillaceae bacterium]MBT6241771.1 sigma-54-dependent Fis family transcriptional regulator [Rhodospirillaceae bacterium]MBT7137645.1 sigma-54-dependent Fis family transcriptional regulator [Rhodospirillaceae bacterium]
MRLLIIGTLDGQIGGASRIAIDRGAQVTQADDINIGLETLRAGNGADLVMIDVNLDVGSLIASLNDERIIVPVVACGIGNDTQAAVRAIKAGAKEFIPLPPDTDLIAAVLSAVTEESHAIIYQDPAMIELLRLADQVAPSNASILVTGESGTGKELIARHLHNKSPRAKARFVAVNCAAIPENLLESELFGYEKGAFTGAVSRRIGKFEEASGGTLLLDEITEMDPRLQAKLLRVLQEREIDRIGGSKPIEVDVRIVATSNRDIADAVAQGTFREDLYFRLNVVNLLLPPLRDRPKDIEYLAKHFIEKYAEANAMEALPLASATKDLLNTHSWSGNVRELENTMHRAVLLASGTEIGPEAVMLGGRATAGAQDGSNEAKGGDMVGRTVAAVERDLIIDTLQHCLGNRTHAANILGISIRTLRNKLKLYNEQGFQVPTPGEADRPSV